MAGTPQKPAAAAAKGGKSKLILIAAGAVVLLLGAGAGAYFLGFVGGGHPASAAARKDAHGGGNGEAADHGEGGGEGEAGAPAVAFVELPDMIVNLQSDGGRSRYLRLKLAIEVPDDRTADTVRALTPRVLDSFQMYLRSLTVAEVQGTPGMMRLKEEMLARANIATEPAHISDVLLKEILVQ